MSAIVIGLFVAALPVWLLVSVSARTFDNHWLPVWIQILAVWIAVFGAALLAGCVVSVLFRGHRAAAVLSMAAAIIVAGAIFLRDAADLSALSLASLLLLDAVAAIGGGSLVVDRTA